MTDDIVARLRDLNPWRDLDWPEVVREAAAKIERLCAEIAYLREPDDRDDQIRFHLAEIARKDAALKRIICEAFNGSSWMMSVATEALAPAQEKTDD